MPRKKPVPDVVRNELGFSDEDTRKQRNRCLAPAGIFRKAPRPTHHRIADTLRLSNPLVTLSESAKIQNQKLPLDDANMKCVANYLSARAGVKAQRVSEPCVDAEVGVEPPSTTTRVPIFTRP
jgi:hypothetical protein